MVGKKSEDLDETCGYYGEKLVLYAQTLGLNTCWVGLTYSKVKDAFVLEDGEKLYCVISIGYGTTQGIPHKSKPFEKVNEDGEGYSRLVSRGRESGAACSHCGEPTEVYLYFGR